MRFGNAEVFRLLIIVAPLVLYFGFRLFIIARNLGVFFDAKTRGKMIYPVSAGMMALKYVLLAASVMLILTALARPWGKPVKSEIQLQGIDVMVTLDVSSSMAADDLKPSRMDAVKDGLKDFIASLNGDRIGFITFAGIEFVQCPLTVDYDAAELILDSVYPGMLAKDGTAIGNAIKESVERLELKGEKSRIMILITDGENNAGMAPVEAARLAKEKGIKIYCIGVGTQQGGKIPEGRDMFGRTSYKAYQGEEVVTKLDDSELREIAGLTGGKYYRVTDKGAFRDINNDLKYMEVNKVKKEEMKHEENYAGWLFWGVIFFVLSQVLPNRVLKLTITNPISQITKVNSKVKTQK